MFEQIMKSENLPQKNILLAFLIFVIIGGGSSVAIRITYTELDPFWVAASRLALGALAHCYIQTYKVS
jgi:drug/metabolite transporter (DMT)-like permease